MAVKKTGARKSKAARVPHIAWARGDAGRLLTNDAGNHVFMPEESFRAYISGRGTGAAAGRGGARDEPLAAAGFVRDRLDFGALAAVWRSRNAYLASGPGLHIFVLTPRCNHGCAYCQSSAAGEANSHKPIGNGGRGKPIANSQDMTPATARICVDFAFRSPSPDITIEFQGGEPLLNWPALKEAVLYARRKAAGAGKTVRFALVSNFSLMTGEKARFLLENGVSVCTSLDGPADLHNANRAFQGGDSHALTVKWLRYFQDAHDNQPAAAPGPRRRGAPVFRPGALLTVSRRSLGRHREIVDEYVRLGLEDIFIRPLAPLGYARNAWTAVGYTTGQFIAFYRAGLDYILGLNRRGTVLREKTAVILLEKILNARDPGYTDLRCPCGAATGQLAYDCNGDVYTCDEGRMSARGGDMTFRLGHAGDAYGRVVSAPAARACALASNLETQPLCHRCAYKPYCGVCPVYNYEEQGSPAGNMPANERCAVYKGVFGTVFSLLGSPDSAGILKKWVRGGESQ